MPDLVEYRADRIGLRKDYEPGIMIEIYTNFPINHSSYLARQSSPNNKLFIIAFYLSLLGIGKDMSIDLVFIV